MNSRSLVSSRRLAIIAPISSTKHFVLRAACRTPMSVFPCGRGNSLACCYPNAATPFYHLKVANQSKLAQRLQENTARNVRRIFYNSRARILSKEHFSIRFPPNHALVCGRGVRYAVQSLPANVQPDDEPPPEEDRNVVPERSRTATVKTPKMTLSNGLVP